MGVFVKKSEVKDQKQNDNDPKYTKKNGLPLVVKYWKWGYVG